MNFFSNELRREIRYCRLASARVQQSDVILAPRTADRHVAHRIRVFFLCAVILVVLGWQPVV